MDFLENLKLVLKIVGLILVLIGTIFIFDARIIVKKLFSFGDQNEGALGMKIIGFFIFIIGTGLILFS